MQLLSLISLYFHPLFYVWCEKKSRKIILKKMIFTMYNLTITKGVQLSADESVRLEACRSLMAVATNGDSFPTWFF